MSYRPIVFKNDIQRPTNMKNKNSIKKSKETIDYENAINALKQRNAPIDNKPDLILQSSDDEFKYQKNITNNFSYQEQNWSPKNDNIAQIPTVNNAQIKPINQQSLKNNKNEKYFIPSPPSTSKSPNRKRRPIPSKPKQSQEI